MQKIKLSNDHIKNIFKEIFNNNHANNPWTYMRKNKQKINKNT